MFYALRLTSSIRLVSPSILIYTEIVIERFVSQIHIPHPTSHKGENGKALIIGGSDLFHAASRWSFLATSRLVDMTFYSSVAENNELIRDAKLYGHDGVVVPRHELAAYIEEADSILIGPGMRRDTSSRFSLDQLGELLPEDLSFDDWEQDTAAVTSVLLRTYPHKKWIIDAGALQVMDPEWMPDQAVLTPHFSELERLLRKLTTDHLWQHTLNQLSNQLNSAAGALSCATQASEPAHFLNTFALEESIREQLHSLSRTYRGATFVLKGPTDVIWNDQEIWLVCGGNAGMTKGGTGDVLAGLLTGFAATSPLLASAVVSSYLNKQAGHELYTRSGHMFNASDVVEQVPLVWRQLQG